MMSAILITSSIATVALIPAELFEPGGAANGRAISYLAHELMGEWFGSAYDLITIAILWFAGASAMAGLLNLIPRFLPSYGMAPEWTRATRPLVMVVTGVAFCITMIFRADGTVQGGAYATGVLMLMTSAAVAVTLSAIQRRHRAAIFGFAVASLVFMYTTVANIVERPDGIKIATCFILVILAVSLISRIVRSTELRAVTVMLDETAIRMIDAVATDTLRLVANNPIDTSPARYRSLIEQMRRSHNLDLANLLIVEVERTDPSEFESDVTVTGVLRNGYPILSIRGSSIPNALGAVALFLHRNYGCAVHLYFGWTEGSPLQNHLRFLFFGEGGIATMVREILREAEPDERLRPAVHVS